MNSLLEGIKKITPQSVWQIARGVKNGAHRTFLLPSAIFHPIRMESKKRLMALKDVHCGERCFIIGNGPSLKETNLTLLKNEYTFGMNRIYLLFSELGFSTTYYLSVNSLVIEQCSHEIQELPMPKFLSWRSREYFQADSDATFLHTTYTGPKFATDARERIWEGATVTYVALQLAYHMGFDKVYLIGVDHNFATEGKPNTTIVSRGDDPNHFDSRYFGKGFRWQLPDLEMSERAYAMAKFTYSKAGRRVFDATVNGKLTIFPKVDYNSLF